MTEDEIGLLKQFDIPTHVDWACFAEFSDRAYGPAPEILAKASVDGLIFDCDFGETVLASPSVYSRCLMLTDSGRIAVGLPPAVKEQPKKDKKPSAQKELF